MRLIQKQIINEIIQINVNIYIDDSRDLELIQVDIQFINIPF